MDRNAPISIVTAIVVSVVGVFGLMTQPMVVGVYADMLGFDYQQGGNVIIAEIAGGALASILAMFWINKVNWRLAVLFALLCVAAGNVLDILPGIGEHRASLHARHIRAIPGQIPVDGGITSAAFGVTHLQHSWHVDATAL